MLLCFLQDRQGEGRGARQNFEPYSLDARGEQSSGTWCACVPFLSFALGTVSSAEAD